MSQEVMTVEMPSHDSPTEMALRHPNEIVDEARERAKVLMDIVKECSLSVSMGKREHLCIEAWQTIAAFFNCVGGSHEAELCDINGVKGAKAKAFVRDAHGQIVSEAVGYCMTNEANWSNRPWFMVASMAQTRAMSKALANKFRWVAVLAGYAGTPAEEMVAEATLPTPSPVSQANPLGFLSGTKYPFNPHKDKDLADPSISLRDLEWLAGTVQANIHDEAKAKYRDRNVQLAAAVEAELNRRCIP